MALYSSFGSSIDSSKGKDVSTKLGLNVVVNFKGVFYSAFGSALQMPDTHVVMICLRALTLTTIKSIS
jgi:hypothetical protein